MQQLALATADWVTWFNINRLHSSLNYLSPIEYETAYYTADARRAA